MDAIRCPYCQREASSSGGCEHQRWSPQQGGPVDFARFVMATRPRTSGSGEAKSKYRSGKKTEKHGGKAEELRNLLTDLRVPYSQF